MADDGLTGLFVTQFKTRLDMKLQQKASLIRGKIEEGYHAGAKMASPINLVAAVQMRTPEGRFAPKVNTPTSYERRWVLPIDKEMDQYVDSFDQLKTPIDPKSKLVEGAASAVARAWDDEIIRAATADSVIGTDANSLSTETFNTTNFRVADTFGASAAVGFTVPKLIEAKRILRHYHNGEELDAGGGVLLIGSQQEADCFNQTLITSADFNKNGGVLNDGRVTRFLGFDIIVTERLPIYTTNTRGVLAFVKSGLYLGMWKDSTTEVQRRFDLSGNPWDISTTVSFGATRTQAGKVIQIACYDTTGADITP